jgi:DNA-binding beta-propeller fold protein YncE
MHRLLMVAAIAVAIGVGAAGSSRLRADPESYKVIQRARVGGEGGWDYIYADPVGRRLYIPRGGTSPRLTIFDLDTLTPVGEIEGVGGNGAAVDPKSGHGFTSSKPVSMFDTKTMKLIKTIEVGERTRPDGILFDAFNDRVYVFSHPTKDATVIDSKDGTVLGSIDLGGVPEQAVADGKGMLYVVLQDAEGSVTAVDVQTMKGTAHYPFGDKGSCNGLAMDLKNRILFAACAHSGGSDIVPPKPMMVILRADEGRILTTLPLAGGSDGAAFNPATMEAFSTHGNGTLTIVKEVNPTTFEVEQNLETMNGARTITLDTKTNRILTMSDERGPAPPPAPGGGRAGRGPAIPGTFTILVIAR